MIGYLDDTLRNLLARDLPSLEGKIYFDVPDRDFKPSIPAVDLFLYDVRENLDLRSTEWQMERSSVTGTRLEPACACGLLLSDHRLGRRH